MPNEHDKEHRPIEDESSVVEQSLGVAIGILDSVIAEYPDVIDIDDLKEIMTHLVDAYTALDTEEHDEPYCDRCGHYTTNGDGPCDCNDHEGEMQAEADAERQADAQAEQEAEACYDDLEGGCY
mgnify:CR=1 FL=1